MSCKLEIEKHCFVSWIPFNNTFTPDNYGPRGRWSGFLLQVGTYKAAESGQTPGMSSMKVTDSAGDEPNWPDNWDWINIVSTDLLPQGEPMERAHLKEIAGQAHAFHQHFTVDTIPRVITFWQGALGYTVKVAPDAHGASRFTFEFAYPVRVDIYAEGELKPTVSFPPGTIAGIALAAEAEPETHQTQQEPPG